jgi:hypothetical protein
MLNPPKTRPGLPGHLDCHLGYIPKIVRFEVELGQRIVYLEGLAEGDRTEGFKSAENGHWVRKNGHWVLTTDTGYGTSDTGCEKWHTRRAFTLVWGENRVVCGRVSAV